MTVLLFSTPLSRDPMKMLAETGIQAPTGFCESLTVPARILKPGAVYRLRHLASPWWPQGVTVAAKRASQCIHSAPYPAIHSLLFEHPPWAKQGTHVGCRHMEKKRARPLLPRNFLITPMLQTKGSESCWVCALKCLSLQLPNKVLLLPLITTACQRQ